MEPLYESLNSVMNKTKAPIKYLLATSVLKLTEADKFVQAHKEEANILYILKVLQSNLRSLDQSSDETVFTNEAGINVSMLEEEEKKGAGEQQLATRPKRSQPAQEQYAGLKFKTHKYCLLAMTNILIKTGCEYIFTRKHKLVPLDELILNDRTNFERDPQMNLRFLTLINIAFKKESQSQDRQEQTFDEKKLKDLIDNILNNIYKFRNILESRESYFIEVPQLTG